MRTVYVEVRGLLLLHSLGVAPVNLLYGNRDDRIDTEGNTVLPNILVTNFGLQNPSPIGRYVAGSLEAFCNDKGFN